MVSGQNTPPALANRALNKADYVMAEEAKEYDDTEDQG